LISANRQIPSVGRKSPGGFHKHGLGSLGELDAEVKKNGISLSGEGGWAIDEEERGGTAGAEEPHRKLLRSKRSFLPAFTRWRGEIRGRVKAAQKREKVSLSFGGGSNGP